MTSAHSSYYFRTKDLVTIAVLSSLGGALSTFVGYLGLLLNAAIGTPFGAGQFLSGLHVFWIILAVGLIRKPGVGTATGLIKGFVEFFTGSTHGLVVIVVSLIQGLIVDSGFAAVRHRDSLPLYCIISGFASASNVIIFQLFYFSGAPWLLILLLVLLAFSSGIIFAGYFGYSTTNLVQSSRILRMPAANTKNQPSTSGRQLDIYRLSAGLFLILIAFGASLYAVFVWRPTLDPLSCDVMGNVAYPYRFSYNVFSSHQITIEAELIGSVTHIPTQNYTGVPLSLIIEAAQPLNSSTQLLVRASDGYTAAFDLHDILLDSSIILIIDSGLRVVAKDYPGEFWVQKVVSLVIT